MADITNNTSNHPINEAEATPPAPSSNENTTYVLSSDKDGATDAESSISPNLEDIITPDRVSRLRKVLEFFSCISNQEPPDKPKKEKSKKN